MGHITDHCYDNKIMNLPYMTSLGPQSLYKIMNKANVAFEHEE